MALFEPSECDSPTPFRGDKAKALETAKSALVGHGFEITYYTDSELHAKGPGMQNNKEAAARGASDVWITLSDSRIELRAVLGGAARMKAFLYLFPAGMALFSLATFGFTHGFEKWWAYVAPLAPWLILSPIMARWIEGRTKKALDTLVRSMAVTAGSPAVGPTIQSPN